MAVIVPGKCWTSCVRCTGIKEEYGVLGPLAEGDYIRRLQLTMMADGKGISRFGASIGASEQPNRESMATGVPVIQRSTIAISGVPLFEFFMVDGVAVNLVVPVGIRSTVGSRYLIFQVYGGTASVGYTFIVSLDVLRQEKMGKD